MNVIDSNVLKRSGNYLGATTSTCPECLALVNAKIISENGCVYFKKYCRAHGFSRALISEDLEYYLRTREYTRPGAVPRCFSTKVNEGCPADCGLCPEHEQHTCHPIIEITDHCNLNCPICMADNQSRGFLPVSDFKEIIETLIKGEGRLENITLSGGEPSLHPDLKELIAASRRPEVSRVSIVTNGIRIAEDAAFCRFLKENDVYVILQWDGFDDNIYRVLRGSSLIEAKQKALDNLEQAGIPTQLIYVAARGINEQQLGRVVRLLLEKDNILSLAIQPIMYNFGPDSLLFVKDEKSNGFDVEDRITVPGVIKALSEQTEGLLKKSDFFPLPCPNPECVSLTYLLRLDDGDYKPFPRFIDMEKYLHLLSHSATIEPNQTMEDALHDIINSLWSTAGEVPDSEKIVKALRRASMEIFSTNVNDDRELIRASERQAKSIFIHHYMDRYSFDLSRVMKCCHHYPRADGRIMPICAFNLFHRKNEVNPFVA